VIISLFSSSISKKLASLCKRWAVLGYGWKLVVLNDEGLMRVLRSWGGDVLIG
jgi:hypothetical protein